MQISKKNKKIYETDEVITIINCPYKELGHYYLAFNTYHTNIPKYFDPSDNTECIKSWALAKHLDVGFGYTPNEAYNSLKSKLSNKN